MSGKDDDPNKGIKRAFKSQARLERMEALQGLRPCEVVTEGCPENPKAGAEVMEAEDLEETLGATVAVAERQELCIEEATWDNVGSLEDRYCDRRLYGTADVCGSRPKEVVGSSRSWPPPENERYTPPSLQCSRDVFVRIQATGGTPNRRMLMRRRWMRPECKNDIGTEAERRHYVCG
jgi:hypothetical protein